MLGLTASIETTAKVNALRWFGHVLRTEENSALKVEVLGKREEI